MKDLSSCTVRLFKKRILFTLSGFNLFLFSFNVEPALENNHSLGTEVAGIHKNIGANCEISQKLD